MINYLNIFFSIEMLRIIASKFYYFACDSKKYSNCAYVFIRYLCYIILTTEIKILKFFFYIQKH